MKHSKLNQLSKDEMVRLALYLDLPEILTFCRLAKKFNRNVCQNKNFWISRLKQDFGFSYLEISPDKTGNPKKYYEFFYKYHNMRLMKAAEKGNIDIVKFMIKEGADVHAYNDYAIKWSSENGHTEIVKLLLENGADIHARYDMALRLASLFGHTETIKVLLENGADVHAQNNQALIWANEQGHTETVKLLKSYY